MKWTLGQLGYSRALVDATNPNSMGSFGKILHLLDRRNLHFLGIARTEISTVLNCTHCTAIFQPTATARRLHRKEDPPSSGGPFRSVEPNVSTPGVRCGAPALTCLAKNHGHQGALVSGRGGQCQDRESFDLTSSSCFASVDSEWLHPSCFLQLHPLLSIDRP